jgi:hypothetical protein
VAQAIEVGVRAAVDRDQRLPCTLALHVFLEAASASAPAGSAIERVSSKMSLIAAQISSVLDGDHLVDGLADACGRSPCRSAPPPHRRRRCPPAASTTRRLAFSAASRQAASSGSTPITRTEGRSVLDVGGDAGDQPAAADRHEHRVERTRELAQDLHADRALAGDHVRVVVGMHEAHALRSRVRMRACMPRRRCRRAAPRAHRAGAPRRP